MRADLFQRHFSHYLRTKIISTKSLHHQAIIRLLAKAFHPYIFVAAPAISSKYCIITSKAKPKNRKMSPLCTNSHDVANADDVLFTTILDKNLLEFARSDVMKNPRSPSLQRSFLEADPKRSCSRRRRVSFGSVKTREFSRTVGDNPACRDGPPLSLGWAYSDDTCEEISVDAHQLKRVWRQSAEGQHMCLYPMSVTERRSLLHWEWSVSKEEMKAAEKEASCVRNARRETNNTNPIAQRVRVIRKRLLGAIQLRHLQEEQEKQ